jgi:hypothetical protein
MKKLLLTSIAALLLATGAAHAAERLIGESIAAPTTNDVTASDAEDNKWELPPSKCQKPDGTWDYACVERSDKDWGPSASKPPRRVTVTPPPGPPPLGWVYGPYTSCADPPRCSTGIVNVPADGLNVRVVPNGPPVMSLVNGVPLIPLGKEGDWLLVAAGCDLTPTWAWSWTAGVPLNRCWVYFP